MRLAFLSLCSVLVLSPFCGAVELAELPEELAVSNGRPIRRSELPAEAATQLAKLEWDRDRILIRRILRNGVDEVVLRRLLDEEFGKYGIVPSRSTAEKYLAGLLRLMPPTSRINFEREVSPRLDDPGFQLKAAVHLYLECRFSPEPLAVSGAEVRRYYDLNRLRYRRPEHWDIGVIRIDRKRENAAEIAVSARARLLQGENFERVAGEVDPEGANGRSTPGELRKLFAPELAAMSPGDISGVIDARDAYFILLLRDRKTGGEIPIEEAAPFIVMEISAAKDTLALRKVLTDALSARPTVYAPFLLQSEPSGQPESASEAPR